MGILVFFHFFLRLHIAILCTVKGVGLGGGVVREGIERKIGALFLDSLSSLLFSHFLDNQSLI